MIEINITPQILLKAEEKAARVGILKNSLKKGEGNLAGFIGEIVVKNYLGGQQIDSFDYDLFLENKKIEIKTKLTAVKPLPYYTCSVASYYLQNCDFYLFVRVKNDYNLAWILGYKSAEDIRKFPLLKKGDFDKSNNFTVKMDNYAIPIKDLETDFEKLKRV